ncbi:cytochrome P450 [Streptomyces rubiginosohelvolus]|uniref:cytochrome P450 n=1 Tax=Streptomyces rubiginosohelvolus TaxID=67362 RepID=UPI0033A0FFF5
MTEPVTDSEVPAYPLCPMDRLDAYPVYDRLRVEEPLAKVRLPYGEPTWLATRHADVRALLMDQRFSREAGLENDAPRFAPGPYAYSIPFMDQPVHTKARKHVARAFTKKRIEALRPHVQQIADDLIDALIARGQGADIVDIIARPLPVAVNCVLYDVPEEDRADFLAWSVGLLSTTDAPVDDFVANFTNLLGYTTKLIAERREKPGDDLVSALVKVWDAQDDFPAEELPNHVVALLLGGHEPVAAHLANSLYTLLERPEAYAQLHERPEIMPTAVEELLRFVSIGDVFGFGSYATEDIELEGGTVREGEPILALLASANRDEKVFERPDELDLTREVNPHVAFGHGPHYCVGAWLARLELQVVLATLARRLPDLRLAGGDRTDWWYDITTVIRGLKKIPVEW